MEWGGEETFVVAIAFSFAPIRPCWCWNILLSTSIHFDSVFEAEGGGAKFMHFQSNIFYAREIYTR